MKSSLLMFLELKIIFLKVSKPVIIVFLSIFVSILSPTISKILYISLNTVRNHIAHLLEKTGFKNRVELAVRAREIGLVIKSRTENDL